MGSYCLFVDAGYLWAGGASLLSGSPSRRNIEFDFIEMRKQLIQLTEQIVDFGRLLRIYWYDAATDRIPTEWHNQISELPNVKLRLGRLDPRSGQKGVDSLIVRDLIILAQERAMTDAILIGGDEDLREGVTDAQARGIRVHLVRIDSPHTFQASTLRREADTVTVIDKTFFDPFASLKRPARTAQKVGGLRFP